LLQRSRDAVQWFTMDSVQAAGFSTSLQTYQSVNIQTEEQYFRLKQFDINGTETIYSTIYLDCSDDNRREAITIPNPSIASFNLVIFANEDEELNLSMYDLSGKSIFSDVLKVQKGTNQFPFNENLPNGVYFLHLKGQIFGTESIKHVIR
jgi:hypothetical protein